MISCCYTHTHEYITSLNYNKFNYKVGIMLHQIMINIARYGGKKYIFLVFILKLKEVLVMRFSHRFLN